MPTPIRVLILEDRPSDAELMLYELRQAGFEPDWRRVDTQPDYLTRLQETPDVILADYSLPQFDAPRALHLLQERGLDIPFIVVTGTVSEEAAVACMKQGAADYLLKDRLTRLGPAVTHALQEKKLRDERRQAEAERLAYLGFLENLERIDRIIRPITDLEQMLEDAIAAVLAIFDCDRVWLLYPCDPNAPSWRVPMECVQPDYPGALDLGVDVPMSDGIAAVFRTALNSDGPVRHDPQSEHPLPPDLAEQFAVQSQMVMAIYPKMGQPWLFGMHQCSYARVWTDEEQGLFKEIVRRITDSLSSLLFFRDLQASEEKFRAIADYTYSWESWHGTDGGLLWVNPAVERLTGYPVEECEDMADYPLPLIHQDDREDMAQVFRQAAQERTSGNDLSFRIQRQDGATRWMAISWQPIYNAEGICLGFRSSIRDITERVRADEEIRRRAAHLEALNAVIAAAVAAPDLPVLLETALDRTLQALELQSGALWIGEAGQYVTRGLPSGFGPASAQVTEAAGLDLSGPIAVADWEQVAESETFAIAWRPLITRLGFRASLTVPILIEKGGIGGLGLAATEPRPWSPEEIALVEAVGQQLGAAVERLRLLEKTRDQAQQVQGIISTVPEGVMLLDADARLLLTNPAADEYLAALTEAGVGDTITHLGGRPLGELLTSPPQQGLWHEITVDGPPRHAFEMIARMMEAGPKAGGWVLVIRDVTQEREIQQHIHQQERLAAVGQLAGGIAHDFNNIMAVIVLYAQMLSRTKGLSPRDQDRAATINQQAHHATSLIRQILDFSRQSVLEQQPLDLLPFVKQQIKLLERTLPESIEIKLAYGRDEHIINADPTRIQQVFMNLAVNARDAMPEGGTLRIELERITVKPGDLLPLPAMSKIQNSKVQNREWVQVTVADSGIGIPPDVLPHIFDPFFTTKEPGKGTGLGLAQVYGIVTQHEGHIDVTSRMGDGTTFTLYLPALSAVEGETLALETFDLAVGQGETLLLVEDNKAAREALRDTLKSLNYRVLEAGNGQEALTVFEQYQNEIELVLTDLVMPVMGGQALFYALRQLDPAIKVVVMTGHPLDEDIERLQSEGVLDWLKKPVDMAQLAQVISRALKVQGT